MHQKGNRGSKKRSSTSTSTSINIAVTHPRKTTRTTTTAKAFHLFVIIVIMTFPPVDGLYKTPFKNLFRKNNRGDEHEPKQQKVPTWTIDLKRGGVGEQYKHRNLEVVNKKKIQKKRELTQYEKDKLADKNICTYVHVSNFIHTLLLLRNGNGNDHSTVSVLASSMFCIKLLKDFLRYPNNEDGGAMHKSSVSLISSAFAFCFKSRSMELLGGVYLTFLQLMAL